MIFDSTSSESTVKVWRSKAHRPTPAAPVASAVRRWLVRSAYSVRSRLLITAASAINGIETMIR